MPADIQPATLWDSRLMHWCQQLKQFEAELVSNEKGGNRDGSTPNLDLDARAHQEASRTDNESRQAADPFAFDLSAFGTEGNAGPAEDPYAFDPSDFGQQQPEEDRTAPREEPKNRAQAQQDPFAFDPGAFGISTAPAQEQDPYAFDPSSFGEQPGPEATEKLHSKQEAAADPFAFDPSAFGETAAPVSQPAEDPFAFDMDAFGDGASTSAAPQQRPSQDADPFAFDMTAFGQPDQMQRAAEEEKNQASRTTSTERPQSKPQQNIIQRGQPSSREPTSQADVGSRAQLESKRQKPNIFSKEPRMVFQALTVSELAALKEVLLPALDTDSSDDQSSSNEAAEEGHKQEEKSQLVAGLSRESAEQVIKLAEVVAVGMPGSIADSSALDNAGQRAATAVQVEPCTLR